MFLFFEDTDGYLKWLSISFCLLKGLASSSESTRATSTHRVYSSRATTVTLPSVTTRLPITLTPENDNSKEISFTSSLKESATLSPAATDIPRTGDQATTSTVQPITEQPERSKQHWLHYCLFACTNAYMCAFLSFTHPTSHLDMCSISFIH